MKEMTISDVIELIEEEADGADMTSQLSHDRSNYVKSEEYRMAKDTLERIAKTIRRRAGMEHPEDIIERLIKATETGKRQWEFKVENEENIYTSEGYTYRETKLAGRLYENDEEIFTGFPMRLSDALRNQVIERLRDKGVI